MTGPTRTVRSSQVGGTAAQPPNAGKAPAAPRVAGRVAVRPQASLRVSSPADPYEREANRVADRVMRMTADDAVMRACACDDEVQRSVAPAPDPGPSGRPDAGVVARAAVTPTGGGRPLDGRTRAWAEGAFAHDFSDVRIHTSGTEARAAESIAARAYTLGRRIVFGSGQYRPDTPGGRRLLAHELTHVIQQGGGQGSDVVHRAEVDDDPARCARLPDVAANVNKFVNDQIAAARRSPGASPVGPFLDEVASRTGGGGAISPIETEIENLPATKRTSPSISGSRFSALPTARGLGIPSIAGFNIYHLQNLGRVHVVGVAANIGGFCVGADKLGHFFQQGFDYFRINRRMGRPVADAESFGRLTEISRAGLGATGVFSNADLAANLAGLRFWTELEATPSMTFDIARYIAADWNEYKNPNFYEPSVARHIWATQLTGTWTGSFGPGPALAPITASLTATSGGSISGSFSYVTSTAVPPVSVVGSISGTITFDTTHVSGSSPVSVLHGSSGSASADPVSGITINFEWVSGANRGKGVWRSKGERELVGTFGNGSARSGAGIFNLVR